MTDDESSEAELPLEGVGARLMRAREAAGKTRAQIAAVTKIPERHLAAIETGNFAALPARTYAIGFARSYARALGLDEAQVAVEVRAELATVEPEPQRRMVPTFEPGDPARVPSARFAWLAALGVVVVLALLFTFWRGFLAPGGELPSILPQETPSASVSTSAAPGAVPSGPVVFTAIQPQVWVKFTDGTGNQLFQKELAQGESYTLPAGTAEVRLSTARPDALSITIGGQPVAKLSETQQVLRDVPVTAAALNARGAASPAAVATGPAPTPVAQAAQPAREPRRQPRDRPQQRDTTANPPVMAPQMAPMTDHAHAPPAMTDSAPPPPAEPTADR